MVTVLRIAPQDRSKICDALRSLLDALQLAHAAPLSSYAALRVDGRIRGLVASSRQACTCHSACSTLGDHRIDKEDIQRDEARDPIRPSHIRYSNGYLSGALSSMAVASTRAVSRCSSSHRSTLDTRRRAFVHVYCRIGEYVNVTVGKSFWCQRRVHA